MTAQRSSNPSPVSSRRPGRRRGWLGVAIVGAVVVVMAGIIALINDSRESLARMMTVWNGTRQGTTSENAVALCTTPGLNEGSVQ